MESQRIRVVVPAPVEVPRGAEWAASAAVWIWRGVALRAIQRLRRRVTAPAQAVPVDRVRIPRCRQVA